jgi:hypothetical protein
MHGGGCNAWWRGYAVQQDGGPSGNKARRSKRAARKELFGQPRRSGAAENDLMPPFPFSLGTIMNPMSCVFKSASKVSRTGRKYSSGRRCYGAERKVTRRRETRAIHPVHYAN